MTTDGQYDTPDPPPLDAATYLIPVAVGACYFAFVVWLASLQARDPGAAVCTTLIHGALLSAVMAWLWLRARDGVSVTPRQVTLAGIFGATAVAAICISFAAQVTRAQVVQADSPVETVAAVIVIALLYFVFSVPFASFLGVGVMRMGEIVLRRLRG